MDQFYGDTMHVTKLYGNSTYTESSCQNEYLGMPRKALLHASPPATEI